MQQRPTSGPQHVLLGAVPQIWSWAAHGHCHPAVLAGPHCLISSPLPHLRRQSIITINISGAASQRVASACSRFKLHNEMICLLRSGTPAGYALMPTYVVTKAGQHPGSRLVNAPLQWPVPSIKIFRSTSDREQGNAFRLLVSKTYLKQSLSAAGRCPRGALPPAAFPLSPRPP